MKRAIASAVCVLLLLTACKPGGGAVDQARIEAGPAGDWLTYGRTYSEQRFSPLTKINTDTVGKLGLAWTYETRVGRGAEGTPIVADGVMYITSAWSIVYALDAKTGKELWVYDPEVDHARGAIACCDVVNRGVALWKGKVYVATLDGRLVAINAKDGTKAWETVTTDPAKPYAITGAPRVAKGLVFIGNGGAELGVRGYVSAYDAETGAMKWRFYTVPGDPSKGPDHAASDPQMAMAAKTWTGEFWRIGGGGTVWDAIVYDQELDQLYIGVGNGSPWDRKVRSPGGGDNLFLASIVALKPETGQYLWHFQTAPGETWDYTATQPIMLATLKIGGADRKVLMQAPKNGFFYVLDRTTGKFISGKNIVPMAKAADTPKGMPISWAYGLDADGRPLENPEARYLNEAARVTPSGAGAHNWYPWSYSPKTGLVYLPVTRTYGDYRSADVFTVQEGFANTGIVRPPHFGTVSASPQLASFTRAELVAWDPVAQKQVWTVPATTSSKNGGTLATAGGLVFWGQATGHFAAFEAQSGKKLWSMEAGQPLVSGAISYEIDGEQYVAVMSGAAQTTQAKPAGVLPLSHLLVFKLGGSAPPPTYPPAQPMPEPPRIDGDAKLAAAGQNTYNQKCVTCHGRDLIGAGVMPDLRYSPMIQDREAFHGVVTGGRAAMGMPDFSKYMTPAESEAVRVFVVGRARKAYDAEQAVQRPSASR